MAHNVPPNIRSYSYKVKITNSDMKRISDDTRNSAISLLQSGLSARDIGVRLGVSKSTISRISKERYTGLKKSKGGRPKLLSEKEESYCVQQVTRKRVSNAVKVAKGVELDLGIKCNPETIRRTLRKHGLGAIEKPKKLYYRLKTSRLDWTGVISTRIGH